MQKCQYYNSKTIGCELRIKPTGCEGDHLRCWFPELLNKSINKVNKTTEIINKTTEKTSAARRPSPELP